jgi:hypothetical protein
MKNSLHQGLGRHHVDCLFSAATVAEAKEKIVLKTNPTDTFHMKNGLISGRKGLLRFTSR